MIRVVVADDQALVRSGLRSLLEEHEDIRVVAEAGDGLAAVAAVERHAPEVCLMDIRMPELDGLEATRKLVAAGNATRILVLTTFDVDEYVFDALRAGASGFLLKDARAEELTDAVRVLARGEALLAPAVTRRVVEQFAALPPRREPPDCLSPRELEVLRLVAQGRSNAEIARELYVSESTAKTHVSSILGKLELRDRIQAVIVAYETGVVAIGGSPR